MPLLRELNSKRFISWSILVYKLKHYVDKVITHNVLLVNSNKVALISKRS